MSGPIIKAIITTMDNLPNNQDQLAILKVDPLIDHVIFVNQGSVDGTEEWLDSFGTSTAHLGTGGEFAKGPVELVRSGNTFITAIHRENKGAGPGRNAGLDAAGFFDYVLMLDGGMRPLHGGIQRMLEYLNSHPGVDGISLDWHTLETDKEKAWRRWPETIRDKDTYHNRVISLTHYGLFRWRAFENFRFADHYPFNQPGWGVDDDEMMHRWDDAGIVIHAVMNIKAYRRASGSFRRLFKETGIWANQYGSNYEERLVWLQQEQPHHAKGMQWGEPWLTVVIEVGNVEETARLIKLTHDRLRERKFDKPWNHYPNPYSIVAWGDDPDWLAWAEPRRLRQHHGDTIILNGEIVRRNAENEETWTGDFRVWTGEDWSEAIRPNAFYFCLVHDENELLAGIAAYNEAYTRQPKNDPPTRKGQLFPQIL